MNTLDSGNITIASDDVQGKQAHTNCGKIIQKKKKPKELDSVDISIASDDEKRNDAHKKRDKPVITSNYPPVKTPDDIKNRKC